MRVVITKNGKQVASAQNLEVLSRYHRQDRYKHPVQKASIKRLPDGGGLLKVRYTDGAKAEVKFASFTVLENWLKTKQKRSGW